MFRACAALAIVLIVSASPLHAATPTLCDAGPLDSERVTWEYSPPVDGAAARLACAGEGIASLIDQSGGDWGLAIRDLNTQETLLANPDHHFVAGSLYKLGVAAEAYARIDEGNLSEESLIFVSTQDVDPEYGWSGYEGGTYLSVRQAVRATISQSDNGAALALVDRLGLNAVNLRFELLGMPETRLVYDAVTTPRDVLSFFTMLADGQVVSREASDHLVELLAAQEINDRIPAGLPVGEAWWVAHKTANLDNLLADAGIVHGPNNAAYALILLNQDLDGYWNSIQTFRSISQSVYHVISPRESFEPRRAPPLMDRSESEAAPAAGRGEV